MAILMVKVSADKMQFYYNVELTSPLGTALAFGPEHHNAYVEPTELVRAMGGVNVNVAFVRRVGVLRALLT